jgi:hypothetical protein
VMVKPERCKGKDDPDNNVCGRETRGTCSATPRWRKT